MGLLVQQKVLHTGRRVEEGGVNHGIKYVKAKCKLASVVHDTFGGIASCNCSNLVPFMDVHCVVQLSTAVTLHLATGSNAVRLYGFKAVRGAGTLRHAHPIMRTHLCVEHQAIK